MKVYKEKTEFEYLGDTSVLDGVSALVTLSSGMRHLDFPTGIFSLIRGENIYGLTRDHNDTYWYASRKPSVIKRFRFLNGELEGLEQVVDLRERMHGAGFGLHAIDFIDNELYIMDTYNNRCLIGSWDKDLEELRILRIIYPRGMHKSIGSYIKNGYHGHFNTVYRVGQYVYMLAHNNTLTTGNPSELYLFNRYTMKLAAIVPNVGIAAHDLVVDISGEMYVCDSGGHEVKKFDGKKFNTVWQDGRNKSFVRGLAMNDDINIIGGSFREDTATGGEKNWVNGLLFVTDKEWNTLCTIKLHGSGQVHQVKFTGLDYSYSNTWRKHGY
jgi:hypothetical protein